MATSCRSALWRGWELCEAVREGLSLGEFQLRIWKAEIVNPTESERRIMNSTMLVTEGEENSPEKLHEFLTTDKISQKVY